MLLFLPPAWVAGYMWATEQFKSNNVLPVLPLVTVAAGWGSVEIWRWLSRRAPEKRRRLLGAACLVLLATAVVPRGVFYVYRSLVPAAEDRAFRFAARQMAGRPGCQIVQERAAPPWPRWERAADFRTCHSRHVERLTDLEPEELRLADGVLFPHHRLTGERAAPYLAAVANADPGLSGVWLPAAFRVRGPGVVTAFHPWNLRQSGHLLELSPRDEGEFRLEAHLPEGLAPGEVLSFSLWLPRPAVLEGQPAPRLKTGGEIVELMPAGGRARGFVYVSSRFRNERPGPRVRLNRDTVVHGEHRIRLTLWRWWREDSPGGRRRQGKP